jgi:peptidoglycan hydrolase-like protein with peptidoglycan-binding domain
VKILQQILGSDASLNYTGGVTGYYGRVTHYAVEAFQIKYAVAKVGGSGYGTVGPKTKAALIAVYGA